MPTSSITYWNVGSLEFRYLLTWYIHRVGQVRVPELVQFLQGRGVQIPGRPSKVVSDALRAEVRRGRVVRLGRGVYGPGHMPRSTAHRISVRVRAIEAESPEAA
ncbi:hypothetical protein [Rhabdothermincola salaria]|uniref:hypothetical protein n=1 Tax=Rhabdothermincola salaria TaxID=2903142 RepID=UPI003211B1FA